MVVHQSEEYSPPTVVSQGQVEVEHVARDTSKNLEKIAQADSLDNAPAAETEETAEVVAAIKASPPNEAVTKEISKCLVASRTTGEEKNESIIGATAAGSQASACGKSFTKSRCSSSCRFRHLVQCQIICRFGLAKYKKERYVYRPNHGFDFNYRRYEP